MQEQFQDFLAGKEFKTGDAGIILVSTGSFLAFFGSQGLVFDENAILEQLGVSLNQARPVRPSHRLKIIQHHTIQCQESPRRKKRAKAKQRSLGSEKMDPH